MAKWIFAVLALLSAGVQANGLPPQSDGCAVLNEIIYEEVTAAGWGIRRSDLVHTNFNEPSVVVCTSTTQAVSSAFSSAVNAIGGDVSWSPDVVRPEDVCLSGFLEQCMPRNGRTEPGVRSFGVASSVASWQAVSDTVLRAMPEGSATDRSIFSRESMRLAVRSALSRRRAE